MAFQVNIGCDFHISAPVSPTGDVHVLLGVEVTSDIDLDSREYKGSLILGSVYSCNSVYWGTFFVCIHFICHTQDLSCTQFNFITLGSLLHTDHLIQWGLYYI